MSVVAVVGLSTVAGTAAAAPVPTDISGLERPESVPALQEWSPGAGEYELDENTRIVLRSSAAEALADTAEIFAGDLTSLGDDVGVSIVVSDEPAVAHDIVLDLGEPDAELGDEGYELTVGESITIEAPETTGVFYGTRTLLQFFTQGRTVDAGQARDWPAYEERGLMVDMGRMPFTYDWLAERIRDMAYLKLNVLQLHLTDDEGWRIESDLGLESEGYLTKVELQSLIELATRYHISIVPEIDMPSHLGSLLEEYPQFQLKDIDGGERLGRLDYSIPEARELLFDIVDEYIDLFPGAYWHMGGDEYLSNSQYADYPQLLEYAQSVVGPDASAKDGTIALVNEMNDFVRSHGKTLRMWNDIVGPSTTTQVDTDVVIHYWTDSDSEDFFGTVGPYTPQTLLDRGYKVLNASFLPTYMYPSGGQSGQIPVEYMYNNMDMEAYYGYLYLDTGNGNIVKYSADHSVAEGAPGVLGSMVNMWNSGGTWTQEEGAADLFPRLRIMAQSTWGSAPSTDTFDAFQSQIARIGTAPAPALRLSSPLWDVAAEGGSTTVSVAATLVTAVASDQPWLTVADVPGGVALTAAQNSSSVARSAAVTVVSGGITGTVIVTQAAAAPVIPPVVDEPEAPTDLPTDTPTDAPSDTPTNAPTNVSPDASAVGPAAVGTSAVTPNQSQAAAAAKAAQLAATGSTIDAGISVLALLLLLAGAGLTVAGVRKNKKSA